jgi:hypothetical protein
VLLFYILQSCDLRNIKPYIWNTCHHVKFKQPLLKGVTFDNMLGCNDTRYLGHRTGTHRHGDEKNAQYPSLPLSCTQTRPINISAVRSMILTAYQIFGAFAKQLRKAFIRFVSYTRPFVVPFCSAVCSYAEQLAPTTRFF